MAVRQRVSLLDAPHSMGQTFFAAFDDHPSRSVCDIDLNMDVIDCPRDNQGFGLAGVMITSFTVTNSPAVIGPHLNNNVVLLGGSAITIPEVSILLVDNMITLLNTYGLKFARTPTGRIRYVGTQVLLIPSLTNTQKPILYSIANMFGITNAPVGDLGGVTGYIIAPNHTGIEYPDVTGPLRDMIVSCEQVKFTSHNKQVVGVVSPTGPVGSVFTRDLAELIRPLILPNGIIDRLTFNITDAVRRPVKLLQGVPTMHFRIIPLV